MYCFKKFVLGEVCSILGNFGPISHLIGIRKDSTMLNIEIDVRGTDDDDKVDKKDDDDVTPWMRTPVSLFWNLHEAQDW